MARDGIIFGALTFTLSLLATLTSFGFAPVAAARPANEAGRKSTVEAERFAGLWVTADGQVRQELVPGGRFVEARWDGEKIREGRYWLEGNHIEYRDGKGFAAAGDFRDGMLHQGGMVLFRRDS
jgi:hypothetical protein